MWRGQNYRLQNVQLSNSITEESGPERISPFTSKLFSAEFSSLNDCEIVWDDPAFAPPARRVGQAASEACPAVARERAKVGTPGSKYAGGHRIRVTPVPIPNTEVKPDTADGTARETVWESRSLPAVIRKKARSRKRSGLFSFEVPSWRSLRWLILGARCITAGDRARALGRLRVTRRGRSNCEGVWRRTPFRARPRLTPVEDNRCREDRLFDGHRGKGLMAADLKALEQRALELMKQADFGPESIRVNAEIVELSPQDDGAWTRLGRCYLEQRQFDEAVTALQSRPRASIPPRRSPRICSPKSASVARSRPPPSSAPPPDSQLASSR